MADRKRGWRWSFVPRRLLRNEKFLALSHADSNILLRLYLSCTGHGRFESGPMSLAITLGIIEPSLDLVERVGHLESQGFVTQYECEGVKYGRLNGYDEDAPADLVRKRGPAILPIDPALSVVLSAVPTPNGRQPSAVRLPIRQRSHAKIRIEEKREEERRRERECPAPYDD